MILEPVAGELHRRHHREECDAEEEDAEQDGEVIDREDAAEVVVGVPVGNGGDDRDDRQPDGGGVAEPLLVNVSERQCSGDDDHGQAGHDEFGDDQLILKVHQCHRPVSELSVNSPPI